MGNDKKTLDEGPYNQPPRDKLAEMVRSVNSEDAVEAVPASKDADKGTAAKDDHSGG